MMHLLHLSADVSRDVALSLRFPGGKDEAETDANLARTVKKLLEIKGAYKCVACVDGDDPETAWKLTQNGVYTQSWSRLPPEGVYPYENGSPSEPPGYGKRSSDVGDLVIVNGTHLHAVAMMGFEDLGNIDCKLPKVDTARADPQGRRLYTSMDEQSGIADLVAQEIRNGRSSADAALSICEERGLSPSLGDALAALGRHGIPFKITEEAFSPCVATILGRGICPPYPAALRALIEGDDGFTEKLNHGYTSKAGVHLDTWEREELLDLIALAFTDRGWPANMDSDEESAAFAEKLSAGMAQQGWTMSDHALPMSALRADVITASGRPRLGRLSEWGIDIVERDLEILRIEAPSEEALRDALEVDLRFVSAVGKVDRDRDNGGLMLPQKDAFAMRDLVAKTVGENTWRYPDATHELRQRKHERFMEKLAERGWRMPGAVASAKP